MPLWLLVPVAYLIGSLPTAGVVGLLTGHDPIREGSGNPGASNMYRVAGRRAGVVVLVLDLVKGLVPSLAGLAIDGRALGLACGVAAVVGHVFPAARVRRGGKGVATTGGLAIALYPLIFLGLLAIWALVVRLARTASVGSLVIAVLFPIAVLATGRPWWEAAAVAGASALVIVRHSSNIARLWRNEERRLTARG